MPSISKGKGSEQLHKEEYSSRFTLDNVLSSFYILGEANIFARNMAEEWRDTWKQNKPANQEREYPQNQSYHSHRKDLILEEISEALGWILRQLCHHGQPIKGTNSRRCQWEISMLRLKS